ncbi:MAG: phosphatidylglycerol lysyltransferase domain-containing protein [Clostridia bacterium]|nr:phosphatidylglycerol lysyltransferase domain-containing protein [Clostridia bacterium]
MLEFKPIEIKDKEIIDKHFKKENHFLCEYCFTDLFIWGKHYNTQFAVADDFLYIKSDGEDGKTDYYFVPDGEGDFKKAMERLFEYTGKVGRPWLFMSVYPELREKVEKYYPNMFEFEENRDNADYVYLAEKLASLSGKKLHKKKNHVNRFYKEYEGRWSYESLNDDNIREFFSYQLDWCEEDNDFLGELCAASTALKNYRELGIEGGILRVDGKIVAVTLGSKSFEDTMIVHIEKADYNINGAYQVINQQFVINSCSDVKYVDREEDLGIEGLRKAKESYYPEFTTLNYMGRLK